MSLPFPRKSSNISLVVVDDNAFTFHNGTLTPRHGDFYRFALELGREVQNVTFCSPVIGLGRHGRRSQTQPLFIQGKNLVPTFPYTRLAHYIRSLPLALRQNVPALTRAILSSDLVIIRAPAANATLAFAITRILRKPTVLFLVGPPAQGALSKGHRRVRRTAIRIGASVEWACLAWMARHVLVFAYGSHLAKHLRRAGARNVSVTFTSLVDCVSANVDRRGNQLCPTILYVGRLAPEKGIDILLQALKLLLADGVRARLDLVGDGPLDASLRSHVGLAGIDVVFHGWLDGPDLDRVFRSADLFVQPSRQEGIPKVLLLAMAHGLPIVATKVGGIPDLILDDVNGLLVPTEDPFRMAQAMRRLLTDSALCGRIGAAGRDFANSHTTEKQAASMWRVIRSAFPSLDDL